MRGELRAPEAQGVLADVFASEAAFDAWYAATVPTVYGYVFNRCGHDAGLAEELTQLTFVEACRERDAFEGRADATTWLCAIARHKLADHFRRLDAEERRNLRLVDGATRGEDAGETSVEEREAIRSALNSLPALQRAVLLFTSLDGLSVREAGALLDRTEGATESLLRRARDSFKRAYTREGGGLDG